MNADDPGDGRAARRIDYYDDPSAPEANSIVPSANVAVVDDDGRILVIHRTDNDNWALPGGAQDFGESLPQCGVRETKEETGIDCEITGLVGIYTDPKHVVHYTSNDEVRQEFSVLFSAHAIGGELAASSESREVLWLAPHELAERRMDRSMRLRVAHLLERRAAPYLG
ncbi:MAG: NUDIX domain-containing protein [Actinobacteria bacterium]|nr:NUDIX domain-containing protein [Actinomycetota bacterium]